MENAFAAGIEVDNPPVVGVEGKKSGHGADLGAATTPPRLFEDFLNLCQRLSDDNVDRFRKILAELFHDNDALKITKQNLDQNAVIRYLAPTGTQINVMVRQGEKIEFSDIDFEMKTVHDVEIKVATPESLLKMKDDSLRPKDQIDIHFFKQIIDERKNAC